MSKMSKNGGRGSPTSFYREQAWKNTLNLQKLELPYRIRSVSVSPKILQLDLLREMFSAKYCSSRPTK